MAHFALPSRKIGNLDRCTFLAEMGDEHMLRPAQNVKQAKIAAQRDVVEYPRETSDSLQRRGVRTPVPDELPT